MSKISDLSDGGVIQGGDTLIAVRSGGNVKVTYGGSTTANIDGGTIDGTVIGGTTPAAGNFTTGSFTGNVSFGDNDKAIFGAGQDLEIFHNGTTNEIRSTTSNIEVKVNGGGNFKVGDEFGNFMFAVNDNSDVQLYHGTTPALKLATTTTGIDVTGTATMDGLTVEASAVRYISLDLDTRGDSNGSVVCRDGSSGNLRNIDIEGQQLQLATNSFDQTASIPRVRVATNGDIQFFEDTGTTAKFHWDAADERLGLGTDSPASNLHLTGAATGLTIEGTTRGDLFLIDSGAATDQKRKTIRSFDGNLIFGTENDAINDFAEAMRISSSGSVDITGPNSAILSLQGGDGNSKNIIFKKTTGGTQQAKIQAVGDDLRFITGSGTDEAFRVDSSQNLLVGKTSSDLGATAGIELNGQYDVGYFTRSAEKALVVSRLTNDGALMDFRKDGTTVGSIGTLNRLTIGNASSGISFNSSTVAVQPHNMSTNLAEDATVSLGVSGARFKDGHFSGNINAATFTATDGIYLGGNGFANKLDDYEEGTWTPVGNSYDGTLTVNSATYTKVGNLVTARASVSFDATADTSGVAFSGLPFSHSGVSKGNGGYVVDSTTANAARIKALGVGTMGFYQSTGAGFSYNDVVSSTLEFALVYESA